jgi:hypothetical protein
MSPAPGVAQPVLSAAAVTDVKAGSTADPFLLYRDGMWHLFFEVWNTDSGRGEIAYAESEDGLVWSYRQVVLREAFHVSYPHVFEWNGTTFMVPESRQANGVRLYRADPFPYRWTFVSELMRGQYADPTVTRQAGRWWMFMQRGLDELCLASSEHLETGWEAHPASPVVAGNRRRTRPGGRVVRDGERLLRFAQDGLPDYGCSLRAFEILEMTTHRYAEREVAASPILRASGAGWNGMGMHHLDARPAPQGGWIAAVDGATLGYF